MKKIFLAFTAIMLFASAQQMYAQGKTVTPPKNSSVSKAILAVVKKKTPNIKKENVFLVQGNWARVVYDVTDGASSVNDHSEKTG